MNPNPSKEEQEIIQPSIEELTARNRELERRIAEKTEELQIAKEEAEAANEAKSIFLSTVSHELRTPLTSIIGFTKLNKKSLDAKVIPGLNEDNRKAIKSANRISENLEVVKSEGERLLNIINDLLDLAKIESGKVEWKIQPANPNQLIERASLAVASLFEEKPTKFTEEGQITLSVEYLPFPIISGASKHKKHLVFRVEDTGPGIPASHIDKIFDRFQQVGDHHTDKPQGTGLGLAICKEIVEHHKGKIWVESEVGKGSIFAFIVPY
jgi:signal transduction histidine kinase